MGNLQNSAQPLRRVQAHTSRAGPPDRAPQFRGIEKAGRVGYRPRLLSRRIGGMAGRQVGETANAYGRTGADRLLLGSYARSRGAALRARGGGRLTGRCRVAAQTKLAHS